jgi:hypothetical protein
VKPGQIMDEVVRYRESRDWVSYVLMAAWRLLTRRGLHLMLLSASQRQACYIVWMAVRSNAHTLASYSMHISCVFGGHRWEPDRRVGPRKPFSKPPSSAVAAGALSSSLRLVTRPTSAPGPRALGALHVNVKFLNCAARLATKYAPWHGG